MDIPGDDEFRKAVDASGLLRPGALAPPPRSSAFTVFAQRSDARLDIATWQDHASRFFGTRVGLVVEKKYAAGAPLVDAARVVVAPNDAAPGTRYCFARPSDADDLAAAETADARAGSPGLGLLARRCRHVWAIAAETDADPLALLLAAIVASVVLGPILTPDGTQLIGVRTARAKLEALRGA